MCSKAGLNVLRPQLRGGKNGFMLAFWAAGFEAPQGMCCTQALAVSGSQLRIPSQELLPMSCFCPRLVSTVMGGANATAAEVFTAFQSKKLRRCERADLILPKCCAAVGSSGLEWLRICPFGVLPRECMAGIDVRVCFVLILSCLRSQHTFTPEELESVYRRVLKSVHHAPEPVREGVCVCQQNLLSQQSPGFITQGWLTTPWAPAHSLRVVLLNPYEPCLQGFVYIGFA